MLWNRVAWIKRAFLQNQSKLKKKKQYNNPKAIQAVYCSPTDI